MAADRGDFAYVHIDRPANHHAWLSDGPVRDDALCHYGCGLRYGDWKAMQSGSPKEGPDGR